MSEFDLDIIHVHGKSFVLANALSHHHDHAPDAQVNIAIGIESDLLDHIHCSQQVGEDPDFCQFRRHAIVSECGMCPYDDLPCESLVRVNHSYTAGFGFAATLIGIVSLYLTWETCGLVPYNWRVVAMVLLAKDVGRC